MDRYKLEAKMSYLVELRQLYGIINTRDVQVDIARRLQQTCDSIERDIGLSQKEQDVTSSHQCIGCGKQDHNLPSHIIDGVGCSDCGDSMIPKGLLKKPHGIEKGPGA